MAEKGKDRRGVLKEKELEPIDPGVPLALSQGSKPELPVHAGHVEGEKGKGLCGIIGFVPEPILLPFPPIPGTGKDHLVSFPGHHGKEPVGAYRTKGKEWLHERAQALQERGLNPEGAERKEEGEEEEEKPQTRYDPCPDSPWWGGNGSCAGEKAGEVLILPGTEAKDHGKEVEVPIVPCGNDKALERDLKDPGEEPDPARSKDPPGEEELPEEHKEARELEDPLGEGVYPGA